MNEFSLVYCIQPIHIGEHTIHLPAVFIATSKAGVPQYFYKIVTKEILDSLGIHPSQEVNFLIQLCEDNTIDAIETRLNKNKKKRTNIIELFKDEEVKNSVISRLNRELAIFFDKISMLNDLHLYYDIQRKIYLPDIELKIPRKDFDCKIILEKTSIGMNYQLQLDCQNHLVIPAETNIIILNDSPCYLIVQDHLYYNSVISGKKISPFLKKKEIFVPQRTIPVYFNKFIKDLVSKVEIEATGFDFESLSPLPIINLKFTENLMTTYLELSVLFDYGDAMFMLEDKATNKVKVEIDENEQPRVYKINRNQTEEAKLLDEIIELGFILNEFRRLTIPEVEDTFDVLAYVINCRESLAKIGVIIMPHTVSNHKISLQKATIDLKYIRTQDWFDIKAIIMVGEIEIPFIKLLNHIKNGTREYLLTNEEVFIIPVEWITKYSLLSKFSNIEDGRILLSKANFPIIEALEEVKVENKSNETDLMTKLPQSLNATLRPYQIDGALWMIDHYINGLGICLADDMGLGKTLQTIALLLYVKENHILNQEQSKGPSIQLSLFENYASFRNSLKTLIVLPSSLLFNWESELRKFSPQLMVKRHTGPGRTHKYQDLENFDVVLTTYQTALRDEKLFQKIDFRMIILDESHYIKNKDSLIFKSLSKLHAYQRISLSGTPIENSLSDLWSQMQFINPRILSDFPFFNKHFKIPIENNRNPQRIEELNSLIRPFLLRRTKRQVLQDLPEMDELVVYSEMDEGQSKLYQSEKSYVRNQILGALNSGESENSLNVLNALMRLRQLANHPILVGMEEESSKYKDVTATINEIVLAENNVLIFSSFVKHLDIYETYLQEQGIGYAKLTGELDGKHREMEVQKFMSQPDCKVFLMSIKAGGVGLNLTKANYVIILDPWWNPFVEHQAIARAHRMGQENKVSVLRFIAKDTVEEKILSLQKNKMHLAAEFVDVGDFPSLGKEELRLLVE